MNVRYLLALACVVGCSSPCFEGEVECDGVCVGLATSAAHCGACGNACGCDESCVDGVCAPIADGTVAVEFGTPCDPEAAFGTPENPCSGGETPSGSGFLACDPIEEACGVACLTDADCREAGLGYICDTRALEDLDPALAGDSTPRMFCVNPACF